VSAHTRTRAHTHTVFYTEWAKASQNSDLNFNVLSNQMKFNLLDIHSSNACSHTHTFIVFTYTQLDSEQFKCRKTEFTKLARLCDAQYETNAYTRDIIFSDNYWLPLPVISLLV